MNYFGGRRNSTRGYDGRFAAAPAAPACTFGQARLMYDAYLAAVCAHQGLRPREVEAQLRRRGECNLDRQWRAAVYARQLALYLANTVDNVPQVLLAQVTGLTPAAVCVALRAIEDLREHRDYDAAVDLIGAEMAAAQGAGA